MKKEWQDIISNLLGVEPIKLNSSTVSAQNRPRLYWTNIYQITDILDINTFISDIVEHDVEEEFFLWELPKWVGSYNLSEIGNNAVINRPHGFNKGSISYSKVRCLTLSSSSDNILKIDNKYRKLTPVEFERLQTVPDNYTACVSDAQRYKMLGNGWTVDVIAHILKHAVFDK